MIDDTTTPEKALASAPPPNTDVLYGQPESGRLPYVVERRVIVSGGDLTDAQPGFDQRTNEPIVTFRFSTAGARKFAQATGENVGRAMAIVVDGEVLSAPVIREPILGGSGQISGQFTVHSATDLAAVLRPRALPVRRPGSPGCAGGAGRSQLAVRHALWRRQTHHRAFRAVRHRRPRPSRTGAD